MDESSTRLLDATPRYRDLTMEKVSVHQTSAPNNLLPEIFIPPLFYAMGGRVPKLMIVKAISPQQRRNDHGEVFEIQPINAGLCQDLGKVLSDGPRLMQGIERLALHSTIQVETSSEGIEDYVCRRESARVSYDQDRIYWITRAFELCCYVFPQYFGAKQR
jgi:hypothetical protein